MIVILAHREDEVAASVERLLRLRAPAGRVRRLDADELILATTWTQSQREGRTTTTLRFAGESRIDSEEIEVVFNRLDYVAASHFAQSAEDHTYAVAEMSALILSWLASLRCPVINKPSSRGLAGARRGLTEWMMLAARAGLPVRDSSFATSSRLFMRRDLVAHAPAGRADLENAYRRQTLTMATLGDSPALFFEPGDQARVRAWVIGEAVLGDRPGGYDESLLRLSRMSGCDLLEIIFAPAGKVCGVNHLPTLLPQKAIGAIADLIEARAKACVSETTV
jgi:hypothetical protein